MLSRLKDFVDLRGAGHTTLRAYQYHAQVLPVTLAVVLGPFIAILYHLTQPADAVLGSFSLAQAVRGLLCGLMLLSLLLSTGWRVLKHRFVRPLLFLAIYAVLTSFAGAYPYENIVFSVRIAFIVLISAGAFHLAEKELVSERWLMICAWVILLTMVFCIGAALVTGKTIDLHKSRYATAGFTNHPAVASCLLLSTLPVFIRLISRSRSAIFAMVLLFASLFFTMRRSALISGMAGLCCCFTTYLMSLQYRPARRTILAFISILIVLLGLGQATSTSADVVEQIEDLSPSEGTGSGRYSFWQITLEHITQRPVGAQLWGEGMGSIRDLLAQRFGLSIGSHNDWLDVISAFGVAGLIGVTWWYLELSRLVWRFHGRQGSLFQGACAAVVIFGLMSVGTGGSFEPPWALTYAALGFWAGCATRERKGHDT